MTNQDADRAELIALMIANRDMDYAAALYKFTPEKMADAILRWLKVRDEQHAARVDGDAARQALTDAYVALRLKRLTQTSHCNLSSSYCFGNGNCKGCDPEPNADRLAEMQQTMHDTYEEAWLKARADQENQNG